MIKAECTCPRDRRNIYRTLGLEESDQGRFALNPPEYQFVPVPPSIPPSDEEITDEAEDDTERSLKTFLDDIVVAYRLTPATTTQNAPVGGEFPRT